APPGGGGAGAAAPPPPPPPHDGAAVMREAMEALQQGDFARARRAADMATRQAPASALAWKTLGMAYAAEDMLEQALPPFTRACELNPREPGACYYLGRTAYFLSRLGIAEKAFRQALLRSDDRARATLGLALVKDADSAPEEAEAFFLDAIGMKADGALRDYGLFLYRQGRQAEAFAALESAGASEELARLRMEAAAAPRATAVAKPAAPIAFEATSLAMTMVNSAAGNKHLVETMMGGVAVLDFDNDGLPDIYVTNGATLPGLEKSDERYWNRLFRNRGDGGFVDVTKRAGVEGLGYTMGAAAADFDGDGFMDLFVVGVRENILYRNRGDGTFEDVTEPAGVRGDHQWSVGAAWLDYDRDGRLDLFVARYVQWDPHQESYCGDRRPGHRTYCHPRLYAPLHNLLYRNEGGGRFRDVSAETGIAAHLGKAMGVTTGDFDNDGWPDIFVGNDAIPNFLFLNRNGRFEEVAIEAGVSLPGDGRPISSMGAASADFDQDGNDDLMITALSNETFPVFRNLGAAAFQDITATTGIASQSLPYSGWGLGLADLDNDGWPDIFTANGHVMDNAELTSSRASKQPNGVFRNQGGGRFALQMLPGDAFHRGAAIADFNRDGRMDVVVTRLNQEPLVLLNRTESSGHWLALELEGNPVGTRIRVTSRSGIRWARLAPYFSYASSSQHLVHIGLGEDSILTELKITWPDSCVQILRDVQADQYLTVQRRCGN
ncbi:MAG: VCBS repeat-containing protein, partial [Bryobacterales bacterium]|nr:VCBS repeat-containing protein [Bryobacterales bacterium]